jgi:transcriptional regulator with XRE-family HTH domain
MEESDFSRIKDAIEQDPNLSAEEVAERANVTVACVFRMLDEGLIASSNTVEDVACGRCGSPAIGPRQRLCTACLLDLDRALTIELNQARLLKKAREMKGTPHHVHEAMQAKRRG